MLQQDLYSAVRPLQFIKTKQEKY